jgi:hypothetical protein
MAAGSRVYETEPVGIKIEFPATLPPIYGLAGPRPNVQVCTNHKRQWNAYQAESSDRQQWRVKAIHTDLTQGGLIIS